MRKQIAFTSALALVLILSGCSSSTDESMSSEEDAQSQASAEPTPSLPPKEQFIKVLNENFVSRLDYWSSAVGVNDKHSQSLFQELKSYQMMLFQLSRLQPMLKLVAKMPI